MADLDAVGNTTKAITKGVAIASAVIAAVSLFASFITDVGRVQAAAGPAGAGFHPYLRYQGLHRLPARRRAALAVQLALHPGGQPARPGMIVEEVRRQFRIPGIMEGTVKPGLCPGGRDLDRSRRKS